MYVILKTRLSSTVSILTLLFINCSEFDLKENYLSSDSHTLYFLTLLWLPNRSVLRSGSLGIFKSVYMNRISLYPSGHPFTSVILNSISVGHNTGSVWGKGVDFICFHTAISEDPQVVVWSNSVQACKLLFQYNGNFTLTRSLDSSRVNLEYVKLSLYLRLSLENINNREFKKLLRWRRRQRR